MKKSNLQFTKTVLGRGVQGIVVKAKYMGSFVAVKCIQKRSKDKLALRIEDCDSAQN